MLSKAISLELISLIEQHAEAAVRVHIMSQFHPNTNLELDEKHNAQKIKVILYKLIDTHTAP